MTGKQKIYPTYRLCDKMNTTMTHCAIFGGIAPENINNTDIAAACVKSGDYVRLLHAVPNEYNDSRLPNGKTLDLDEEADAIFGSMLSPSRGQIRISKWVIKRFNLKKMIILK